MKLEKFKTDILPLREKLYQLSLGILGNAEDAEDSVQETLLKLWSIREQLPAHPNPAGLAVTTAKNISIDKWRSRKTEVEPADFYIGTENKTPARDMEEKDAFEMVNKIILSLPELQKQIILMRDVEGYELWEIAQITGTQVSAVTMNLSRARKKVRDRFLEISTFKQHETNNESGRRTIKKIL